MMLLLPRPGTGLTCCNHSGYNPPQFVIDAAKDALDRVECNQYSPTKVRRWNSAVSNISVNRVSKGTSSAEESHCRSLLTILWEKARP